MLRVTVHLKILVIIKIGGGGHIKMPNPAFKWKRPILQSAINPDLTTAM